MMKNTIDLEFGKIVCCLCRQKYFVILRKHGKYSKFKIVLLIILSLIQATNLEIKLTDKCI